MSSPSFHQLQQEWHTPIRNNVLVLRKHEKKSFKYIVNNTGIPYLIIRDICLTEDSLSKRNYNRKNFEEIKGRKPKLSLTEIYLLERFLQEKDFEIKTLSWNQLAEEIG